jgi:hypothetical protein
MVFAVVGPNRQPVLVADLAHNQSPRWMDATAQDLLLRVPGTTEHALVPAGIGVVPIGVEAYPGPALDLLGHD